MDIRYHLGIDIAKATLDWAVYDGRTVVFQTSTANTVGGVKIALRLLKTLPGWKPDQAVFCMEHTGIYNAHLLDFLHKLRFPIWVVCKLKKPGVYNEARPTRLMPSRSAGAGLLNMLTAFETSFGSGSHRVKSFSS